MSLKSMMALCLSLTDEWIPFFKIASRNLDSDAPVVRKILADLAVLASVSMEGSPAVGSGHKLSDEAQFAMGWWFYTVYVQEWFVHGLLTHMQSKNGRVHNEDAALAIFESRLKDQDCKAQVSLHKERSIFTKYWSWLMR